MRRKNKKRIDPRYFLHETALQEQPPEAAPSGPPTDDKKIFTGHPGIRLGAANSSINRLIGDLGRGPFTATTGDPGSRICKIGACTEYIFADVPFKTLNSLYSGLKQAKVPTQEVKATEGAPDVQTFKWGPYGTQQVYYEGTLQIPMANGQYDQNGTGTFSITLNPEAHK